MKIQKWQNKFIDGAEGRKKNCKCRNCKIKDKKAEILECWIKKLRKT